MEQPKNHFIYYQTWPDNIKLINLGGCFEGPKFFLVGISWVQSSFLWVFRGSRSFSRGYFVGLKFFLVGISWVQNFSRGYSWVWNFFSWVFSWVLQFLVGIPWVRNFFLVSIWWSNFFSCGWFVIQRFSVTSCISKSDKNRNKKYISNHIFFLEKCIRKVLHLPNYLRYYTAFICSNCIFRHLFFSVLGSFHS